ncbi:CaiB/BaiF CoA transferase family protein [Rhodococcus koreensis]|uniref:CaiB/BaiF CoA transferase family protein n=1 Tax=Rhodococcus koreensis TaxID=99653 RepID=UPI00366B0F86
MEETLVNDDSRGVVRPVTPNAGPLAGVRILDLTTVVMGPSATRILADLGADVIKVESPNGDTMRWIGPDRSPGMGPLYLQSNHNKRSIRLDLKTEEDLAALRSLIPTVDVIVTNVRPAGMTRLGLDYDGIRDLNDSIIYCSAVGYGTSGPESGKAVYDDLMQAASGIADLFGQVDGEPRYAPINLCDRIVGNYLVIGIIAALYHRLATGEGQFVEVPMFETMAQFVLADHIGGEAFVPAAGEMGYRRLLSRTRRPYPTKDGHIAVVVYSNKHWQAFSAFLGIDDLTQSDPRFASQDSRTVHAEEIGTFLSEQFTSRTTGEWLDILATIDIPASPVNSVRDLLDDPHLRDIEFFQEREHPTEGTLRVSRFPIDFEKSPATLSRLAPTLGEHNSELLGGADRAATPSRELADEVTA